jgi:hypothetical protein
MKIIILIMSSTNKIYEQLEKSIKETWYNNTNSQVEIIFYKDGFSDEIIFDGCDLILPISDGYENLGIRTIAAFDWVDKNYNYDFIYRSNLGAFIDINNMICFLEDKPKKEFYCGVYGKYWIENEFNFASGSGYFLSRDLIELLVHNTNSFPQKIVDDVAVGCFLYKFNIKINKNAKRKNICNNQIFYEIGNKTVDFIPDDEIYHVRLRSDDRSLDIQNMKKLYHK